MLTELRVKHLLKCLEIFKTRIASWACMKIRNEISDWKWDYNEQRNQYEIGLEHDLSMLRKS